MTWRDFEAAAPELARIGRERFERTGLALLGTLRKDGSPRISPVEPFLVGQHLLLGLMAWSEKAQDLRRDPRCVLHSTVSDPGGSEGEFKLYGRVAEVDDPRVRAAPPGAWWVSRPREDALVVSVEVASAAAVDWDVQRGQMVVLRWTPRHGVTEARRPYP